MLAVFDGTAASAAGLVWAADEAYSRCASLVISTELPSSTSHVGDRCPDGFDGLSEAVTGLRERYPSLVVETLATGLDLRLAIVAAAARADLLVFGHAQHESSHDLLMSSILRTSARSSPCPTIVVRGSRVGPMRRIVVGVDGSSAAAAALSMACDEALLHDAQLSVVHVREREFAWADAQSVLDMAVNKCRDRTMRTVTGALASGPAWSALAEASRYANLVCVGSRGRSGFKTAVFGSVALRVAEHADCPVAITHPRATGH